MAERSTLQRGLGVLSGRAEPTGWAAPEGSYVFVLGSDEPGWTGFFGPTDSVDIFQSDTYTTEKIIRFRARLRGPAVAPPTGWKWQAFAEASGSELWTRDLETGRTVDLEDIAITLNGLGGTIDFRIGLRVVGPGAADPVELEIPAFYVDEVTLDSEVDDLIVANRNPEPGETDVSRSTEIVFDLVESGTSSPDGGTLVVTIDGVLAYDGPGSGAQPGYAVAITGPGTGVLRCRVTLPYVLDSLREVPVRVQASNVAGTASVDTTWTFTTIDETAPRVESAASISHDVVRVVFDEPITAEDASSSTDALNPENYAFAYLEAPAVEVEATGVAIVDARTVDVTLDIPITRGVLYTVTVTGVEDVYGNAIAAPYNVATFAGYQCPQPDGREFGLWDFIPKKNRQQDVTRDLFKFVAILQEVSELLLCDIDRWTVIIDVDTAPEWALDHMLIGLGKPKEFDVFDLTVEDKRRLIRVLVDVYRQKGTAVGIINVVRFFLGLEVTIRSFLSEGWILGEDELGEDTYLAPSSSRERYSFEVVSPVVLTEEQRDRIEILVEYMKPAHTHHVRTVEPENPEVIDHLELGLSELGPGDEWALH